jgi:Uma2 family endonuclease
VVARARERGDAVITKQAVTAEQFCEMPEVPGKRFELVRGELIEMPGAGVLHSVIAALIYRLIFAHAEERNLGMAFPDGLGYVLRHHPDIVRIPGASFVASGRIPEGDLPKGFWDLAPDLAVEVVSPNDMADDVHDKVHEYLEMGTRLVWVVWPKTHTVSVHTVDETSRELDSGDELDGGDVLPDLRVRVADLFDVGVKQ